MKISKTLPLVTALFGLFALTQQATEAAPDAISAASLLLSVTNITETTATINITKDKYDYGTRTLCYDVAPAVATKNCTTKTAVAKTGNFSITGLKAKTTYNYKIEAIDTRDGERPYNTTGTFTTLEAKPTSLFRSLKAHRSISENGNRRVNLLGQRVDQWQMKKELKALKVIR